MGKPTRPIERRYLSQWLKMPQALGKLGDRTVGGTVARFERRSTPIAGWVEVVGDRFFKKCQADGWPKVISRLNFSDMALLGSTSGKTLRFSHGCGDLTFEADVPQSLPIVVEYFERGDIQDLAITWQVFEDDWSHDGGYPVRSLVSGRLLEIAPVMTTDSDAINTDGGLRSLAEHFSTTLEEVVALRERNELGRLFGWTPPEPNPIPVVPERDPILLGRDGRVAYVEAMASEDQLPEVLDNYAVKVKPGDLVKNRIKRGKQI